MTGSLHLSPDTEAILLLCGHFEAREGGPKPLTPSQFAALAEWLEQHDRQPHTLLDVFDDLDDISTSGLDREHVLRLLDRGPALALSAERWMNQGMWIISRADPAYPSRLLERLGRLAPPILYGAGETSLLEERGLAIVGSRKVDDAGETFAREIAMKAARDGLTVISGGAKGVDRTAMTGALEAGGPVVGVLAERLGHAIVQADFRNAIRSQQLVLVSPYNPDAGFSKGNAMGRNKLIYALANWALVVATAAGNGGTWAGARENLEKGWTPLLVRAGSDAPPGNNDLVNIGGIALDTATVLSATSLVELLTGLSQPSERQTIRQAQLEPAARPDEPGDAIFYAAWSHIAPLLESPRTMKSLQDLLEPSIAPRQLQIWMKRAVDAGLIERKTKPVRYQLKKVRQQTFEL